MVVYSPGLFPPSNPAYFPTSQPEYDGGGVGVIQPANALLIDDNGIDKLTIQNSTTDILLLGA